MRRILAVALLLALMLGGCAKGPDAMQQALDFRASVLQSGGCRFKARITADYEEQVFQFTLDCAYSPETGAEMTIIEPQTLAGLRAVCTERGAQIEYAGASFGLGALGGGRLAPMELPLLLGQSWCGEYIAAAGSAENGWRMTCTVGYDEDELRVDTWLSDDGLPEYCELSAGGKLLLSAELYEFQLQRQ